MWSQVYDPFHSMLFSAGVAVIPVFVLLASIGIFEVRAHTAAILGLTAAVVVLVIIAAVLAFSAVSILFLYGLLLAQAHLPQNQSRKSERSPKVCGNRLIDLAVTQ